MIIALSNADAVGWVCFGLGIVVLLTGLSVGLYLSFKKAPEEVGKAKAKLDQAKSELANAKQQLTATQQTLQPGQAPQVGATALGAAAGSTQAAATSTDKASSALQEIDSIIGSLPENLRFAGMLVLVGTVLIGVATVQFGGTSLF